MISNYFMQTNHFADIEEGPWYIAGIAVQNLVSFVRREQPHKSAWYPIQHSLVETFGKVWIVGVPRLIHILFKK